MSRNIFNLALDFYQAPAEHRDLLDPAAPLPQDVSFLLDALTENKDPRSEQPKELSADLRAAIQFLIERVFFAPGADCYRILGLNIGARTDEVRKHYNQLLHIFALDQADRSGEWNATYATQINRAYSVLRDPERRVAYDQNLLQPAAGGKGPGGGHLREAKSAGDAEPAKAPRKVSYLNPAAPSARSLTPAQEIQELQRQLLSGASDAAEKSPPSERPAPAPEPSPRSSFIANRIDRASGIVEPAKAGVPDKPSINDDKSWALQPDPAAGSPEHFPRGIPVTAPEPDTSRRKRIFSMDRASFALIVAVFLVLIVYAFVLPNRFLGDPGSEPELRSEAAGEQSADAANGNVVREAPQAADGGITAAPSVPVRDGGVADIGRGTVEPTARDGTAALSSPVPQTGARQLAVIPPADSGPVGGAGVDGKQSLNATAKAEAATPPRPDKVTSGATPARKDAAQSSTATVRSDPGTEVASPSKKLESMRQSTQPSSVPASAPPVARKPQEASRTTAGVKPPELKSAPSLSTAAPGVTAPPAASARAAVETSKSTSLASAQPSQSGNGITIQELDRLGETFSNAYGAGDLALLVSLFSEDARTNDQSSRAGIEQDYRDLFQLSERRTFTFGRLRWEQDKNGDGLKGEGDFQAEVQLKGESSVTTVTGKLVFHVKRTASGIVITEMLHTYN